tara:strand:+ start:8035 stop:8262 length:228 start_codon:yes stop_codon:yes gene_type:complete
MDALTTYHGLKSPYVYEANPILGKRPSAGEIVVLKLLMGSIIWHTYNNDQMIVANSLLTIAVVNNLDVMNKVGLL